MNPSDETRAAAEVAEHLEQQDIDLRVVRWMAGEGALAPAQVKRIGGLRRERGEAFYSDLVFVLMGRCYPHAQARDIWNALTAHRDALARALGRNPGIVVAALDWLTNIRNDEGTEYKLIGSGQLDDILARALVDGLTDLYDHDTFLSLLERECERGRRHAQEFSLLMLDLDDFKQVNDDLGHQKGDEVLATLADTLRESLRGEDIAGRYGGEEFAVILPETERSAAVDSAERLRKTVETRFRVDTGTTISVGIAGFPVDGDDPVQLVAAADQALYAAKTAGKNRVVARNEVS